MNPIGAEPYIVLSMVLFLMGALGVLMRRNAILLFMSVELMLNSANLALVAFAREWGQVNGHVFVFLCHDRGRGRSRDRPGVDREYFPRTSEHQY